MSDLIARVAAEPFAGAFLWLRAIDPLYQAEIGVEREWEVKVFRYTCGCNCPHCNNEESKTVVVEAVTAAEALEAAAVDLSDGWTIDGIRPRGSRADFADADCVARAS